MTISKEIHDTLREAQDLNRHIVPDADIATILHMALELLVEKARKRQFAETDRPRKARAEAVDPDAGTRRRARTGEARVEPADAARTTRPSGIATAEPPFAAEVRATLVALGYKAKQARAAVDAVGDRVGGDATAEAVLCEALRAAMPRCREPGVSWRRAAERARPRA